MCFQNHSVEIKACNSRVQPEKDVMEVLPRGRDPILAPAWSTARTRQSAAVWIIKNRLPFHSHKRKLAFIRTDDETQTTTYNLAQFAYCGVFCEAIPQELHRS